MPGVSLGVAVGVGLGVGLGLSAALSGVFAAVGLVQFTVANAQEFIDNPNVQSLGSAEICRDQTSLDMWRLKSNR